MTRIVHYRQTSYSSVVHPAQGLVSRLVDAARVRIPCHHIAYQAFRWPDIVRAEGQCDITVGDHPHDAAAALDDGQEPAIMQAHFTDCDPQVRVRTYGGQVR